MRARLLVPSGVPEYSSLETARPLFDREPRHDLDQPPQARRAGRGETLKAAIAVAALLKLARQIVQRRSPVAQLNQVARRQNAAGAREETEIRRPLVREERLAR